MEQQLGDLVMQVTALQQQVLAAGAQAQAATAAAQHADEERRQMMVLLQASMAQGSPSIVDGRGVGQPGKYGGKSDTDFLEWSYKFVTFLRAKFGQHPQVEELMKWAAKQRKIIDTVADEGDARRVNWIRAFAHDAPQLQGLMPAIYTYLISFTTGVANKIVRNSGHDCALEAWRRLHAENDPNSAMRRVAILGKVQNPEKVSDIRHLGLALENWLMLKNQYEQYTDNDGQACRVSEDSLVAALHRMTPKSLEDQLIFNAGEDDSFEGLWEKLSSYAATKHSLALASKKDPDAMDVGGVDRKEAVQCWVCGKTGHYGRDCRQRADGDGCWICGDLGHRSGACPQKPKGKGKGKGKDKGGKGKGKEKGKSKGKGKGKFGSKGKGKGKFGSKGKGKGANSVEENWPGEWAEDWGSSWDGDWQDASSWQDAGSSWGEDAAWSEQAEPEPDIATVGSMGALDISTASSSSKKKTPWRSWYGGREWIRFNYDTGAAAVALPLEVAEGIPLKQVGSFVVASGAEIPNWGTVAMKALDEDGYPREIEGAVTEVHKPLAGGAALAKAHDAMVWDDGGVLIPKTHVIAKKLRNYYWELCSVHDTGRLIELHREGPMYNFYLSPTGPPTKAAASSLQKGGAKEKVAGSWQWVPAAAGAAGAAGAADAQSSRPLGNGSGPAQQ